LFIDSNCVYFAGGFERNELWRRKVDGTGEPQKLDPNCGSALFVEGDYVYFAHPLVTPLTPGVTKELRKTSNQRKIGSIPFWHI